MLHKVAVIIIRNQI